MNTDYTVIDSDAYAAAGIETFFFAGGEPHVKLPKALPERILLFLKLRTWNDVGIAACLLDALDHLEQSPDVRAFIPYFPAARQDRAQDGTPFTLSITALLLQRFPVYLFDPHSDVTEFMLDAARECMGGGDESPVVLMPRDLAPDLGQYDAVIAPDEGAVARAGSLGDYLCGVPLIQCEKVRDFATGRITGYTMPALPFSGRYLIVDDICDGGATFNMLAQAFEKDMFSEDSTLDLWVSHGIFSKGVANLDHRINLVHTTNSWFSWDHVGRVDRGVILHDLSSLFDQIMEPL